MRLKSRLRIFKTARTLAACARHAATAVPSAMLESRASRFAHAARKRRAPLWESIWNFGVKSGVLPGEIVIRFAQK